MPDHLNYFIPYDTKGPEYEDQLTRGFFALMRIVPAVEWAFLDRVRGYQRENSSHQVIPPHAELRRVPSEIRTQVGGSNLDPGAHVVSVLLSSIQEEHKVAIRWSEREARYDAVIEFGDGWTIIVENKPFDTGASDEQLMPSSRGVDVSRVSLETVAVVVQWRDVLTDLQALTEGEFLGAAEGRLIEQFREYVNVLKPELNPYPTLGACGGVKSLLSLRCGDLMREIAGDLVGYHQGGDYAIRLASQPVQEVYVKPGDEPGGTSWFISLEINAADTVRQARSFYTRSLDVEGLLSLRGKGWMVEPNLKLSYMGTGLVWCSPSLALEEYVRFWLENSEEIGQRARGRDDFASVLDWLAQRGLIDSDNDRLRLAEKFVKTHRDSMNICPGLNIWFKWSAHDAVALDAEGRFGSAVVERISEVFATWRADFRSVVAKQRADLAASGT